MALSSMHRFTAARIVALALIALMVGGLFYLHSGPGNAPLRVPDGAQAGDLALEPCEYDGEHGNAAADCGTLVVAENRDDPTSRLIALPVLRVRALADQPQEPIFFFTGGPGQSNMGFELAERYTGDRDFVMVGYRGVDGSVRLDCPEVSAAMRHSRDLAGEAYAQAAGEAFRACADRWTADGVDLATYGLPQQIDDAEDARVALGYDRINLLSESAGTRTALVYAWRYPDSIHRSVQVSVNPPGNFLWYPEPTEEQIGRFAELCAGDDDCRTRTDDLAATVRDTAADLPERWLFLPIKEGNVRVVSMFGLFDTTPQAGTSYAPRTFDVWLSAAEGDASGLWLTSLIGDLLVPDLFVYGQHAAAGLSDAEASRDYFAAYASGYETDLAYASTSFGFARGRLADAWPVPDEVEAYADVRPSEVETLLVSGELDVATPPQIAAEQLLPQLANGQQVILPGFGHQSTVFTEQPEASTRLITTFYDSGGVDDSLVAPIELDFDPGLTFGALAKVALAVLIALAALAALALALVARRVHTKGRIGTASSAALRSALPVVLGLGGWSLAALVALATMPAVHIDHALVVVLGSGLPIGLGIYWAWVRRDRSASTRQAGLALSLMGALVGAWLGFLATGGLLGVVTGIIGAILGANLALLVLDISRPTASPAPGGQVP